MKPLPNPITEREVKIELQWSADERTCQALQRQSRLMGFDSPTDYMLQAIAATLAGNEEDTVVTDDGRLVCASHAFTMEWPRMRENNGAKGCDPSRIREL